MISFIFKEIGAVFFKELICGLRLRASWAVMFMFALSVLACISVAAQGEVLSARLYAALFWIILFFSSITGIERAFADEDMAGTLLTLRVYVSAQAVLFGKMLYAFFVLAALSLCIGPLFLIFFNVFVSDPLIFLGTALLGLWGVSAAGTLTAALSVGAGGNGLFFILLLPVLLPVFLPVISLTAAAFGGGSADLAYLGGVLLYDLLLTVGASVLFDYLWYED